MTESARKFTILLGSAANDPSTVSSPGKAVAAATPKDMTAARADMSPSSLDHLDVIVNADDLALYDPMELSGWVKCLHEGATVSVTVLGGQKGDLSAIHSSFTLAGLKGASERKEANGSRVFTATRPSAIKSSGAKPLKLKSTTAVSISLNDDDAFGNEDDLIDEDGLLSGGDLAAPPAMEETATKSGDDCGGRKACDNCSCGRADEEAGAKKKEGAKKESCGKCGLGDAFRCASCPYLGMPAFKPGEEPVLLDLKDDI